MIERRTAQRRRVLKQGTLTFSGGLSADCTVRSISPNGARIEIADSVSLPKSFMLVIASDHFKRQCHAVWSSDHLIGVSFD